LERVADRVKMGGHNVPEDVVRRRYDKGLSNFNKIYRALSDSWAIFDNSSSIPQLIAYEENNMLTVIDSDLFSFISGEMELK
jgi:predicted ABC-type ATPase